MQNPEPIKCPKCGWWIINGWHWGEPTKSAEKAGKNVVNNLIRQAK